MRLRSLLLLTIACGLVPLVAAAQPAEIDPKIADLVAKVSAERLKATVETLQSFHTRNTLSRQDDPKQGIGAAAAWIHAQFVAAGPRLQVSFDDYDIPKQGDRIVRDTRVRNVMAILPGRRPRRIYVSGHYDSLARVVRPAGAAAASSAQPVAAPTEARPAATAATGQATQGQAGPGQARPAADATGGFDWGNADNVAPGANDDGSGTALVMELARVFAQSGMEFDATIVFIALAGEEQGLVGAKLHAQKAAAEKIRIDGVFNNDMVGNSVGGNGIVDAESVRVFAEGPEDSPSRAMARYIQRIAARYVPSHVVRPIARHDRFGRGGDHTAFNQNGFAGVRITESNENYARQHTVDDLAEAVDAVYMARNSRVNVAAVATMAMAPEAPQVNDDRGRPQLGRQPSGYDARLQWKASAGAVAYRVYWREAWTPDWQHDVVVGNVTEFVLPNVSIDDYVFGVSAIGAGGHESVVSAYVNPPRPEQPITVK